MQTVSSSAVIDGPIDKVFGLMADVNFISSIHSNIKSIELLSDNSRGINASRRMNMLDSHSMVETVTDFEENKMIRYISSEYKAPMKTLGMLQTFEAQDSNKTMVYAIQIKTLGRHFNGI